MINATESESPSFHFFPNPLYDSSIAYDHVKSRLSRSEAEVTAWEAGGLFGVRFCKNAGAASAKISPCFRPILFEASPLICALNKDNRQLGRLKQKRKDQPITILVSTICDWFSIWLRVTILTPSIKALTYYGSETVLYCFSFVQFFVSTHVKESKHCQLGPFLSRFHNSSCQKEIIDLALVLSKRSWGLC